MARRMRWVVPVGFLLATAGCGRSQPAVTVPAPAAPLPTAPLAGQQVTVYPLTLIADDQELGWQQSLTPRGDALARADSVIEALLTERSPEVVWVPPAELRRAARRAPGMLTDPDRMATAVLRARNVVQVPDPLRSQMRNLNSVAGDRYALVPASLVFVPGDNGRGRAELTLALVDVRTGLIGWRTVAHAEGDDPWSALVAAFKTLVPELP